MTVPDALPCPPAPPGSLAVSLCLAALLSACTVGPDYQPPQPKLPAHWKAISPPETPLAPQTGDQLDRWWLSFHDPVLNRLIEQAQVSNPDLGIAFSRIEQARAERRAQRAELFPKVTGVALPVTTHNMLPVQEAPSGMAQGTPHLNYFLAGFDALWEIDLFGRLRRKLEAATAASESAQEDQREAQLMVCSEMARLYTDYRQTEAQIGLTQDLLATREHALALTGQLLEAGLQGRDAVDHARAETEQTRALLPTLESRRVATQHRMETLAGQQPGTLEHLLGTPGDLPESPEQALLATPAETLRNRPDLRSAERNLAAATAQQGAAFAELFPKISVAAFVGLHNSDLENLFRSAAFSWASGSAILQPIFNFGRIRAGIDLADARQQEALLNYEKTLLEALRETETALTDYLKALQQRRILTDSTAALRHALLMAEARHQQGLSTQLEVLAAQRALQTEMLELIQSRAWVTTRLIALYKALGGTRPSEPPADDPLRPWG